MACLCSVAALTLPGCLLPSGTDKPRDVAEPGPWTIADRPVWEMTPAEREAITPKGAATGRQSATVQGPKVVQMEVYICTLPSGSVSQSTDFWKLADEQAVDVAAYDVLFRNGFRVGVVPLSAWPMAKVMLDKYPVQVQQGVAVAENEGRLDIPSRSQPAGQTLGVFDARGDLSLKTFDACENLLALSFQPSPTDGGAARVVLAPVVREKRERISQARPGDGIVPPLQFAKPETFYSINLAVNVPYGAMLVLAPSEQASRTTSLGYNFLIDEHPSERVERVLLMRPMAAEKGTGFLAKPVLLPPTPEREAPPKSAAPAEGALPPAATRPDDTAQPILGGVRTGELPPK